MAKPGELFGRQAPREFSGSQIKRLKKSMQQRGYDPSKPIDIAIVDGRKVIIEGHHRARAAGAAGIKEVPVRIHQVDAATAARLEQEAAQAAQELGLESRW
jgi:filamentous hemagglutinin